MTGLNPFQDEQLDDGKITFNRLKEITGDFSHELGNGGIGAVYKGTTKTNVLVAVKRHYDVTVPQARNKEEYEKNVRVLMKHDHANVVRLHAFCRKEDTRYEEPTIQYQPSESEDIVETLLCYEYFDKGSLHKNLFGEEAVRFDWNKRYEIIKGICLGLQSLHNAKPFILHLNLKPQNVMLDDKDVPKITDFAYSRLFGEGYTRKLTSSFLGSWGYQAPEYANTKRGNKEISKRTDIYSLGIIILEIITHLENIRGKKWGVPAEKEGTSRGSAKAYIDYVKMKYQNVAVLIREKYAGLSDEGPKQVEACMKIGIECVTSNQDARPKIDDIVSKLGASRKDKGLAAPRA